MANNLSEEWEKVAEHELDDLIKLLWGNEIKHDVFLRWTQGFEFSQHEPSALVQLSGGPCAVIAPLQAFVIKNMIFKYNKSTSWSDITVTERNSYFCSAMYDVLSHTEPDTDQYVLLKCEPPHASSHQTHCASEEDGESTPKKSCLSHEHFHQNLRCIKCSSNELQQHINMNMSGFLGSYGILLFLYSVLLTKGLERIRGEIEDPTESLIDSCHGHGSQSLINMMITGRAVNNVWDNDKQVTGLTLHGIPHQANVGFLTLLEHLRYCEVGWYLKNPVYPVWLLASETHLTVLFSCEQSLVGVATPETVAHRMFSNFDTEGCGFVVSSRIGDLMKALDLVSEPEYVKIMVDKMDPEQLGIVTLNAFLDEFFPTHTNGDTMTSFTLYHYNGLQSANPNQRVTYYEATATLLEQPEVQIITDTSPIKHCLNTKWPTLELQWKDVHIPSLN